MNVLQIHDCAGADLRALSRTAADIVFDDAVEHAVWCIHASPAPVIAAVDGPCIGAALEVALARDIAIRMAEFNRRALTSPRVLLRELDAEECDLTAYTDARVALLGSPMRLEAPARRRGSNGTA